MKETGYFSETEIMDNPEHGRDNGDAASADGSEDTTLCPAGSLRAVVKPYSLLTGLVLTCTALLAVPVLLFYFIYSPAEQSTMSLIGFTFHDAVYLFLLSAVMLIVCSLFFLRLKPLATGLFYLIALFCCFPLVVGLRQNLTLLETVTAIPYFRSWPFFVTPMYILLEFLLPAGVVLFLYLQGKNLFSEKKQHNVFLVSAIYLCGAAFLGLSCLSSAGQANILCLFNGASMGEPSATRNSSSAYGTQLAVQQNNLVALSLKDKAVSYLGEHGDNSTESGATATIDFGSTATAIPRGMQTDANPEGRRDFSGTSQKIQPIDSIEMRLEQLLASFDKKIEEVKKLEKVNAVERQREMVILSNRIESLSAKLDRMTTLIAVTGSAKYQDDSGPVADKQKSKEQDTVSEFGMGKNTLGKVNRQLDLLEQKMENITSGLSEDTR